MVALTICLAWLQSHARDPYLAPVGRSAMVALTICLVGHARDPYLATVGCPAMVALTICLVWLQS